MDNGFGASFDEFWVVGRLGRRVFEVVLKMDFLRPWSSWLSWRRFAGGFCCSKGSVDGW